MKEFIKKYGVIVITIILITVSIIARIPKEDKYYQNSDATYHTLLIMQCYDETPVSVHKFLPIVSLGNDEDKNISWGACASDSNGNYYYTSFSSIGYIMPYLFVKLFHLPINEYSLYAFNSILYIVTFILTAYIYCKLFSKYIGKNLIIFFTALIYLFQIEIMHSQGAVYWVHSLFQLLLAVHFILFMHYKNKKAKIAFFIMCFILPFTEWTGYISNVAFAIILLMQRIIQDKKFTLKVLTEPLIIGAITILAFVAFSAHVLTNLSFDVYIQSLEERFLARNIATNTVHKTGILNLLKGYIVSYKYIILLCSAIFLVILSIKDYRVRLWKLMKEYKYPLIFFTVIMLENILMAQHAIEYTFDRMKLIYLIMLVFYIMFATICTCDKSDKRFFTHFIILILMMVSVVNLMKYQSGYGKYVTKNKFNVANKIMAEYVTKRFNHENSIMISSSVVRGYMNLLFHRGIYEVVRTPKEAEEIVAEYKKRYMVFLDINLNDEMGNTIKKIYMKDLVTGKDNTISVDKKNKLRVKGEELVLVNGGN